MVSKASDDLPDPDNPVKTTNLSRGMVTSIPFRLCTRAPRMTIFSRAIGSSSFRLQLDDHVPELGGPLELQYPRRILHYLSQLAIQLAALLFAVTAHLHDSS